MKEYLRKGLTALALTGTALGFSACAGRIDNSHPTPIEQPAVTIPEDMIGLDTTYVYVENPEFREFTINTRECNKIAWDEINRLRRELCPQPFNPDHQRIFNEEYDRIISLVNTRQDSCSMAIPQHLKDAQPYNKNIESIFDLESIYQTSTDLVQELCNASPDQFYFQVEGDSLVHSDSTFIINRDGERINLTDKILIEPVNTFSGYLNRDEMRLSGRTTNKFTRTKSVTAKIFKDGLVQKIKLTDYFTADGALERPFEDRTLDGLEVTFDIPPHINKGTISRTRIIFEDWKSVQNLRWSYEINKDLRDMKELPWETRKRLANITRHLLTEQGN
jgi:hypothetical protein